MIRKLNDRQLDRLSEFVANVAVAMLAALVIPVLLEPGRVAATAIIQALGLSVVGLITSLTLLEHDRD